MAERPHINEPHIIYDRSIMAEGHGNPNLVIFSLGRQNEDVIDQFMVTKETAAQLGKLLTTWSKL